MSQKFDIDIELKMFKCLPNCGFGYQRRAVYCVDKYNNHVKDYSLCNLDYMPLKHQICFNNC